MVLLLLLAATVQADSLPRQTFQSVALSALQQGQLDLGDRLQYLEDPEAQLAINSILSQHHAWQAVEAQVPNFGFTQSAFWFHAVLHNDLSKDVSYLLEIANPILDYVDLYLVKDDQVIATFRTGDQRHFADRPIDHRNLLLPVDIGAGEQLSLYIHARTDGAMQMPITLWETNRFYEYDQYAFAWQLVFAGIMLALAAYNFSLLIAVRDISYLWYSLNVVVLMFIQLSLRGVTFQFLWPTWPELNNIVLVASATLSVGFASLFTYTLLDIKHYGRFLRTFVLGTAAVGFVSCALSLFMDYAISIRLLVLVVAIAAPGVWLVGVYLWYKGNELAKLYTIAWAILHIGHAVLVFSKMGILPQAMVFEYAPQIGASLEVLLLSLALAYRINIERRRRFLAQADLLEAERQARTANERALQIQQQANEQLEDRVAERTRELQIANQRLLEISAIDGLTQVKNRRYFETTLAQEWRRSARDQTELALLMIDVDHFKQVNDRHGHLAGDACLQHLAKVYEECVHRPADFVARYGGEEFVVLLGQTSLEGAQSVAERIRHQVETTPVHWEREQIPLTVSIGVASTIPNHPQDPKSLLQRADELLYAAKRGGRNQVRVASD